jgi:hypothetical protein
MNPNTIKIDEVEYVRSDSVNSTLGSEVRIVIAQRGWVFVGYYHPHDDGETFELRNASVIRNWGTNKGLGQITPKPTPSTVLDPCGTVTLHTLAIVAVLDADAEGWRSHLKTP